MRHLRPDFGRHMWHAQLQGSGHLPLAAFELTPEGPTRVGRGCAGTSNITALLYLHDHERHVISLWFAMCKLRYVRQDAFDDFA